MQALHLGNTVVPLPRSQHAVVVPTEETLDPLLSGMAIQQSAAVLTGQAGLWVCMSFGARSIAHFLFCAQRLITVSVCCLRGMCAEVQAFLTGMSDEVVFSDDVDCWWLWYAQGRALRVLSCRLSFSFPCRSSAFSLLSLSASLCRIGMPFRCNGSSLSELQSWQCTMLVFIGSDWLQQCHSSFGGCV